jgi:beta-glucanase (GH16 family)
MICKNRTLRSWLSLSLFIFWTSTAVAIDSPRDPRGTEVGQSLVKWEWERVSDAEMYEVVIDGVHAGLTRDPQYFSFNLWEGDHSLTVRAKSWNGEYSAATPTAKIHVSNWFSATNHNRSYIVGQENTSTASAPPPSVVQAEAVTVPTDVRGTVTAAGTIKWEWASVPGAYNYDVTVDGGYSGTTRDTSFRSSDLWEGDHSMTVVAVSANGDVSEPSLTIKVWVSSGNQPAAHNGSAVDSNSNVAVLASPPPAGNPDAASVQSMIDPASYGYDDVYRLAGYDLVFSDEFEGTSLNPYRWNTGLRWDGEYNGERYEYRVINGEDQFYVNIFSEDEEHIRDLTPSHNPFEFDGSRLAIRAIKNPLKTNNGNRAYGSMKQIASQQDFLSGAITTHDKFSQKFGYFEARIKIPNHVGSFPAFWLFHENRAWEGTQRSEIDIMENLGHAPWYVYNSFHYFKNVSTNYSGDAHFVKPYPNGQIYTGTDYSQDYHVYAAEWQPGKVTWFIDGEKVSELEHNEVNFEELYVKLNLAMGGGWTNYPANAGGLGRSEDQHFPNQDDLNNFNNPALEIDYVRVYKKR